MNLSDLQARLDTLFPGLMGIRLSEASADRVVATMVVRPELATGGDTLHGGAMMAFADTLGAVGTVINLGPGQRTVTTNSSTSFLTGAAVGSSVTGECIALHRGRTTHVWQTTIRNDKGRSCAVVTQT
ncbi:MAG: PaaI family thioesterase, partial [Aquabacterium sp.]